MLGNLKNLYKDMGPKSDKEDCVSKQTQIGHINLMAKQTAANKKTVFIKYLRSLCTVATLIIYACAALLQEKSAEIVPFLRVSSFLWFFFLFTYLYGCRNMTSHIIVSLHLLIIQLLIFFYLINKCCSFITRYPSFSKHRTSIISNQLNIKLIP